MSSAFVSPQATVKPFAAAVLNIPHLNRQGGDGLQSGIERIREEAREDGYQSGHADGAREGYRDGYAAGERQGREDIQTQLVASREAEYAELQSALRIKGDQIDAEWKAWIDAAEGALTERVMDAVRAVTSAELALSRQGVLAIVQECLTEITHARDVRIRVNAVDAPVLEKYRERLAREMDASGSIEVVRDESIGAGAIIESSAGRVDGTIETRLELLQEAWDDAA